MMRTAVFAALMLILLVGCDLFNPPVVDSSTRVPFAPSDLAVTVVGSDALTLAWTDNANNETSFVVERKTADGAFAEVATPAADATTYADTGLTASTAYTYRVKALNSVGSSDWSTEITGTTSAASTPAAPSDLQIVSVGNDSLTLGWTDNASNETSFVVERKTAAGAFAEVATPVADATTYADSGLTASTAYTYRVKALNSVGSSDWSTELPGTTTSAGNFVESHTPSTANSAEIRVGKDNSYAKGAGQKIHLARSYLPSQFTVWIKNDNNSAFDIGTSGTTDVAVTLQLKIWNTTGTEIGSSTASVAAGYLGPVAFAITMTTAIAAEEKVTYAVYLPSALADDINGNLEMDNTDAYKPGDTLATVMQTTTATDISVATYAKYTSLSRDLRFKLEGTYQN